MFWLFYNPDQKIAACGSSYMSQRLLCVVPYSLTRPFARCAMRLGIT
jgi:Na+-driven multidrug efflux pump